MIFPHTSCETSQWSSLCRWLSIFHCSPVVIYYTKISKKKYEREKEVSFVNRNDMKLHGTTRCAVLCFYTAIMAIIVKGPQIWSTNSNR